MGVVATGKMDPSQPSGHTGAGSAAGAPTRTLDVLFIMRSLKGYLRFFRLPLELLVERGHNVRLLVERTNHGEVEQQWLDRMLERPNFACDIVDHLGDPPWHRRRVALRRGLEYVHVLHVGNAKSTVHFRKRLGHAPPTIRRLAELPLIRTRRGLGGLYRVLCALDRAFPTPPIAVEYVETLRPDVLALCDHGYVGSLHSAYAQVAKELGIPVAICVATWDNLTSRQRIRMVPEVLVVWNQRQLQEAVELHGMPAERVAVTGAPNFDDLFSWKPRSRSEFLARVGLDPARPVLLWVGGALYRSERTEAEYAAEWLAALRSADDLALREAGVLLRPHPLRLKQWLSVDFSRFGNAVVWPAENMTFPVDTELRADFFDSIYHARAVVGLNTSAMIEASIVGRPVLTVLEPEFHDSQQGTYHFSYLLESSGGAVRVAHSIAEQLADLSEIFAGRDGGAAEQARRFVAEFVRPQGLERPATPIFAETLERAAAAPVSPERDPLWVLAIRGTLLLENWLATSRRRTKKRLRLKRRGRTLVNRSRRLLRFARLKRLKRRGRALVKQARRLERRGRTVVKKARRFVVLSRWATTRIRPGRLPNLLRKAPPTKTAERTESTHVLLDEAGSAKGSWQGAGRANDICHCRNVTYDTVQESIDDGARTVAELQRRTTACTRCFGCRSELERMLRLSLGDAYRHEATVTLPSEYARTQPARPMYMPVLAGFRGAEVDTRVIAFNWEGEEKPVRVRADLLRPDGVRVKVWTQEIPYGCSAVLDVDRATVGALLPEGVGVLKLVLDTDEIGSLRPYFQFLTPTCITSTHEKKGPSKRGKKDQATGIRRYDRSYHWIFPVGVGERDEEAYFFCTNLQLDPMEGELVWTSDGGGTSSVPIPTLELDQTACVPLHESFDDVRTGARGGSVWLTPATHVVAGFMIRHDRERQLWRVQHL